MCAAVFALFFRVFIVSLFMRVLMLSSTYDDSGDSPPPAVQYRSFFRSVFVLYVFQCPRVNSISRQSLSLYLLLFPKFMKDKC